MSIAFIWNALQKNGKNSEGSEWLQREGRGSGSTEIGCSEP